MIRAAIFAVLDWIAAQLKAWRHHKTLEDTADAQEHNDVRERGGAGDVAGRLRDRGAAKRPDRIPY